MFSLGNAIDRLSNSGKTAFPATFTDAQKRQRVCETLERFFDFGSWRGLKKRIALTTTNSIITLDSAYLRLDGLSDSCVGRIEIRPIEAEFQPAGFGVIHTPTDFCGEIAYDRGDVDGQREYLLTGADATNDARTLVGLARRRFTWLTDLGATIEPDSYQALKLGVKALRAEDEGDTTRAKSLFTDALAALDSNLDEFEGQSAYGPLQTDPFTGAGSIANLV